MANSSGLAPTITATGITAGDFAEWQQYIVSQYQSIFGADSYLGNDSKDGQYISVIAQALADCCAGAVAAYNAKSPSTAQGSGLSSVVKINGLTRLVPTSSTVALTIIGVSGTQITNGQAIDLNQVVWNLPALVTIPASGVVTVLATCSETGAIGGAAGTITQIQTPVYGWQSVTNPSDATLGKPVEMDAALRIRQAQSVAIPSVTIFDGILANIEQLPNVTRVRGYENNTSSTDSNSTPANTLYFVVEGGDPAAIAQAIGIKITPGVPTRGAIATVYTSPGGSTKTVKFDRPTVATIKVALTIKALAGWQLSTETLITAALVNYIESLPGGANVSYLSIPTVALLQGTPQFGTFAITSLTITKNSGSAQTTDIQLAYNEMAVSDATKITYTVT